MLGNRYALFNRFRCISNPSMYFTSTKSFIEKIAVSFCFTLFNAFNELDSNNKSSTYNVMMGREFSPFKYAVFTSI